MSLFLSLDLQRLLWSLQGDLLDGVGDLLGILQPGGATKFCLQFQRSEACVQHHQNSCLASYCWCGWSGVLGSVLLYCTDYTYLAQGLGIVGLVLRGAGRIMMVTMRNQAAKAKQL